MLSAAILIGGTGCGLSTERIAELRDIQGWKVGEVQEASGLIVSVSGLVAHSALATGKICLSRSGDELWLRIELVPTRRELTGRIEERLFVPTHVVRILFGEERRAIWIASNDRRIGKQKVVN
jgi:hypothetical protein